MDKLKILTSSLVVLALLLTSVTILATALSDDLKSKRPVADTFSLIGSPGTGLGSWFRVDSRPPLQPIPGWNPVDNWQVQQCELNLITEKNLVSGGVPDRPYFFSENAEVTMQAQKRLTPEGIWENNLGYFIQTYNESEKYDITITLEDDSIIKLSELVSGVGEGKASPQGTSNFAAWTSTKEPIKATIKVASSTLTTSFVKKEGSE